MRQPSADRALYYRQLRASIRASLVPELRSAQAKDTAALIDRILAEFIVEEEWAPALSAEFGPALGGADPVTPDAFHDVRRQAAERPTPALAEAERRFLERVDELRTAVIAETADVEPHLQCSVTADELSASLRSFDPGARVEELALVPGGRSKETILAVVSGGTTLPPKVIVRKDRSVGLLQTRAADEFAVIKAVYDHGGVPVPEPFFADDTYEVMAWVPGVKAGEYFPDLAAPTDYQREIGLQLAAALARLHTMPVAQEGAPTEDSLRAAIDALVAKIGELSGPPCVAVPLAREWLLAHVGDVVPGPTLGMLQGDFGLHNMLVDGPRLTALVDWEAAGVGPPARELAAAWNPATALLPWESFIDAYIAAGGSAEEADPKRIMFYRLFGALGAFMTSRLGGHLFRTGVKRDLLTAHSGLDSHFRAARNLARALADAGAVAQDDQPLITG
jgi:aminoglycoside phosphotransferase (APT) family kinase protein